MFDGYQIAFVTMEYFSRKISPDDTPTLSVKYCKNP